jgi:hypothetical protein
MVRTNAIMHTMVPSTQPGHMSSQPDVSPRGFFATECRGPVGRCGLMDLFEMFSPKEADPSESWRRGFSIRPLGGRCVRHATLRCTIKRRAILKGA